MGKINKSDTTPEMEQAGALAREQMKSKKCQHFEEDTFIMLNNRCGKIVSRYDGLLLILWEDGTLGDVLPHALNRSF